MKINQKQKLIFFAFKFRRAQQEQSTQPTINQTTGVHILLHTQAFAQSLDRTCLCMLCLLQNLYIPKVNSSISFVCFVLCSATLRCAVSCVSYVNRCACDCQILPENCRKICMNVSECWLRLQLAVCIMCILRSIV